MKLLLIALILTLVATAANAQYSVTGSVSVKAGGVFTVTWKAPTDALRTYDTIAVCNGNTWLAHAATGGAVRGTTTFTAAPVPLLTIKYFRSNPWFPGALDATPVATFQTYVIP